MHYNSGVVVKGFFMWLALTHFPRENFATKPDRPEQLTGAYIVPSPRCFPFSGAQYTVIQLTTIYIYIYIHIYIYIYIETGVFQFIYTVIQLKSYEYIYIETGVFQFI